MNELIYQSTRSRALTATAERAILAGIAPDGGLYTPASLASARLNLAEVLAMPPLSRCARVLSALLPGFGEEELLALARSAYDGKFESDELTPTAFVGEDAVLELYHGPTSAFKDVALCLLPHLMHAAAAKCGEDGEALILTATSGDTGKAAMSGFCGAPGARVIVFYPENGVSEVQKRQMVTQSGGNVLACAVRGNFDDAQTGVKRIFASGMPGLSSANSINIGRLAPQVVYYFSAYQAMVAGGRARMGEPVDFVVPTGNFGDILAGYIARELGLPVGRLVCASNANDVLTEFLRTGRYDRRRPFHQTLSPSMDILVSSNLERLLFLLGKDEALVASLMRALAEEGCYQVPDAMLAQLQSLFWAGCCDDEATCETIGEVWHEHGYLIDTHTAVAWNVAQQYKKAVPGHSPLVVLSTASPYKFPQAVLRGLGLDVPEDGFAAIRALEEATGVPVPEGLRGLEARPVLHRDVIDVDEMQDYVIRKAKEPAWTK